MAASTRSRGMAGRAPGTAPAAAHQLGHRALPPGGPPAPAGGRDSPGEGVRPEGGLDSRAHHVQVDPDEGQRLAVDGAQRAGGPPAPDGAEYLRLDPLRADALVAQDGTRRRTSRGRRQQQVLTADKAVLEPAGIGLGLDDDVAGILGEALEHHRLPIRRPYLRWMVCLVTPRRLAMSCQDQPSSRAFSTWSSSSRSASARRAATARSPTSGSLLAAPSAICRVVSMPVSIC